MHLVHEKRVAYSSFMAILRLLSLFPKSYCHYARSSNTFTCCANICKQSIREDIDHKALIGIRFMYRLHIMHPSNPKDEQTLPHHLTRIEAHRGDGDSGERR
jgi:hypothetical protein